MGLVGVRLDWQAPVRFYEASPGLHLEPGERVLVVDAEGERAGVVVIAPGQLLGSEVALQAVGHVTRAPAEDGSVMSRGGETEGARLLRSLEGIE